MFAFELIQKGPSPAEMNNKMHKFLCELQLIGNCYSSLDVEGISAQEFHHILGILFHSLQNNNLLNQLHGLPHDHRLANDTVRTVLRERVREMIREVLQVDTEADASWGPLSNSASSFMIVIQILWGRQDAADMVHRLEQIHQQGLHPSNEADAVENIWPEVRQILETTLTQT
jgi:hypothetical protein